MQPRLSQTLRWTALICASGAVLLSTTAQAQRPPRQEDDVIGVFVHADGGEGDGDSPTFSVQTHQPTEAEKQRMREEMRRLQAMTPEQRDQYFRDQQAKMEAQRTDDLREALAQAGETDPANQDFILAFIRDQRALRRPLNRQRRDLGQSLITGKLTDEEAAARQKELRQAVETAKAQYDAALKTLDEKVKFSKKPRLAALLTAVGVLDDTAAFTTGPTGLETLVPPKLPTPGG
jgi:hypothetical protein